MWLNYVPSRTQFSTLFRGVSPVKHIWKTMKNSTKSSEYRWEYEDYYDYMDPVLVNASTLTYNRYSIVLIFWVLLAAFIGFFFLILIHISHTGQLTRGPGVKKSGLPLMKDQESPRTRYE
ncbi:melanocortin-2 receptor accessory protein [Misgurnus anguillicaudatus]|uniref:melanocortin-2 receptor accessory protein n=1 Tax=Misgurnus anguillicaudatus TaxID=75329 RepID=UPI003CCF365F